MSDRLQALEAVAEASRALGLRCLRRPDSKLESDPGDCGKCVRCRLRAALARLDFEEAPWNPDEREEADRPAGERAGGRMSGAVVDELRRRLDSAREYWRAKKRRSRSR